MGKKLKPLEETAGYKRKQAGILKQKKRHDRTLAKKAVAHQANKLALDTLAEEAFGEGGITPQRLAALSAVVVGPEGGELSVTSPRALQVFIRKARKKFFEHAENYVNIHLASTIAAHAAGEHDVAARHAEWAMTNLGDEEVRVVAPAPKVEQPRGAPIVVGVNLGGLAGREDKG